MEKEKNNKSIPTTVLLDFVAKDIPYTQDKERDKQREYANELEQREPFRDIKHKIDRMSKQILALEETVQRLLNHTHTEIGVVVVPIESRIGRGF
jgi:cell division septum initiation protein DivIVA